MSTLDDVNGFVEFLLQKGCDSIDGMLLDKIKATAVDQQGVELELVVEPKHLNGYGGLHGGMLALLVDWAGSLAISANIQTIISGVTADLSISCIRKATVRDVLKYS